ILYSFIFYGIISSLITDVEEDHSEFDVYSSSEEKKDSNERSSNYDRCQSSGIGPSINKENVQEVWVDEADIKEAMQFNNDVPDNQHADTTQTDHSHLMTAILLFILSWQKTYVVSDRGIQCLVAFIKHLLLTIATIFNIDALTKFVKILPGTLFTIRKFLGLDRDAFKQYVVCAKCHSVYLFEDCFKTKFNGKKVSLKCQHVAFPQHQHRSRQKQCGEVLLKK
ncbi:uncharacterized protein LOC144363196, partial [Saccoglossus kowalevskii]